MPCYASSQLPIWLWRPAGPCFERHRRGVHSCQACKLAKSRAQAAKPQQRTVEHARCCPACRHAMYTAQPSYKHEETEKRRRQIHAGARGCMQHAQHAGPKHMRDGPSATEHRTSTSASAPPQRRSSNASCMTSAALSLRPCVPDTLQLGDPAARPRLNDTALPSVQPASH